MMVTAHVRHSPYLSRYKVEIPIAGRVRTNRCLNQWPNSLKIGVMKTPEADPIQKIHRLYRDQEILEAQVSVAPDVLHKVLKDLEQDKDDRIT